MLKRIEQDAAASLRLRSGWPWRRSMNVCYCRAKRQSFPLKI